MFSRCSWLVLAALLVAALGVGGLDVRAAGQRVRDLGLAPRRRDLTVHAADRSFVLPASRLRVTADVQGAVARAVVDSRRDWIGARVARELTGGKVREQIPLVTHYAPGAIKPLVEQVAAATKREAVDATVVPAADGLQKKPSKPGRALERRKLLDILARAAANPSLPVNVAAPVRKVDAKVQTSDLEEKFAAYIVVDRKAHELRFFRHLKPFKTYGIAVGRAAWRRRRGGMTSSGGDQPVVAGPQRRVGGLARRDDGAAGSGQPDPGALDGL